MSEERLGGRELIEKVYSDVEDPELRGQLLDLIAERREEPGEKAGGSCLGISADTIRTVVTLLIYLTAISGLLLVIVGLLAIRPENPRVQNTLMFYWIIAAIVLSTGKILFLKLIVRKLRSNTRSHKESRPPREPWETRVYRGSATIPRKANNGGE
jgi:hypothetical protein